MQRLRLSTTKSSPRTEKCEEKLVLMRQREAKSFKLIDEKALEIQKLITKTSSDRTVMDVLNERVHQLRQQSQFTQREKNDLNARSKTLNH